MHTASALELVLGVNLEARLLVHVDPVRRSSGEEEGEIERISVVGSDDRWLRLANVLEEAADRGGLRGRRERGRGRGASDTGEGVSRRRRRGGRKFGTG